MLVRSDMWYAWITLVFGLPAPFGVILGVSYGGHLGGLVGFAVGFSLSLLMVELIPLPKWMDYMFPSPNGDSEPPAAGAEGEKSPIPKIS